jgi:ribosome-binding factor A
MGDRKSRNDRKGGDKSQRQLKVGEEIRHVISDILLRHPFYEPELEGVSVTVSEVSISPDFANARVYVMPLGGVDPDGVLEALGRISKTIQHELSRRLTIRRTPKLRFQLDSSFDTASRISALIGENSNANERE